MRQRGWEQRRIDLAKQIDSEWHLLKTGADIEDIDIEDSMYVYAFANSRFGNDVVVDLWPERVAELMAWGQVGCTRGEEYGVPEPLRGVPVCEQLGWFPGGWRRERCKGWPEIVGYVTAQFPDCAVRNTKIDDARRIDAEWCRLCRLRNPTDTYIEASVEVYDDAERAFGRKSVAHLWPELGKPEHLRGVPVRKQPSQWGWPSGWAWEAPPPGSENGEECVDLWHEVEGGASAVGGQIDASGVVGSHSGQKATAPLCRYR